MDDIVITLIGAGVCCVAIGVGLFIKLCSVKEADTAPKKSKKLLDDEYKENFKEAFKRTGSIEGTLQELADIYMNDNPYMYNLILSSLSYIQDEFGDYETALEKINVDSDLEVMKLHNAAIKESLKKKNEKEKKSEPEETKPAVLETKPEEEYDFDFDEEPEDKTESNSDSDEDSELPDSDSGKEPEKPVTDNDVDGDDDDDYFKI